MTSSASPAGDERTRDDDPRRAELERENAELRARVEQLARSERAAHEAVAKELPVAYATLDEAGVVLECNALFAELLGLELEQARGLALEHAIAVPAHLPRLRAHLAALWSAPGRPRRCELWLRSPDGGIAEVRLHSVAARAGRCRSVLLAREDGATGSVETDRRASASSSRRPQPQAPERRTPAPSEPAPRVPPSTVLVVEDEPLVRKAVHHYLTSAGHRVLSAADRAQALACCTDADAAIDLVLTDLSLDDGATGPEIVERVRERFPNVGVLYMTACPPELLARRGFEVPPGETLEKPFGKDALLERVRAALAAAKQPARDP